MSPRRPTPATADGVSSVELLVALVLTLAVVAAGVAVVRPATAASQAEPEAMDMQQRARAASQALIDALVPAGAGLEAGPRTGPLVSVLPPLVPRRMGLINPDGHQTARSDALTVFSVPALAPQTRLLAPLPSASATLVVEAMPGCPIGHALCGLSTGDTVVLFDGLGDFDLFTLTATSPAGAAVAAHRSDASHAYQVGAAVAAASSQTFYFDSGRRQLRRYDGYRSDVPVADHIVGLAFSYLGDPSPPVAPKPPPGIANCLYDASGLLRPGLATLAPSGGSLAILPLAMLSDGPWCGTGQNRFDADLLRVRQVRVRIRVEAGNDTLRSVGPGFVVAGSSRDALRNLPDYLVAFGVSPVNLSLRR